MSDKNKSTTDEETLKYFRQNIFEAQLAYTVWKVISYSKSKGVVGEEAADRYVQIQKMYPEFFLTTERCALISFCMLVCHPFDTNRSDTFSLDKIDSVLYEKFYNENKKTIESLKKVRHKVFAHADNSGLGKDLKIPNVLELDLFMKNLGEFYNKLTSKFEGSHTIFEFDRLKREVELLFMNLDRGELVRKKEIEIEWKWEKSDKKISDLI